MNDSEIQNRIMRLEEKVAFQEQTIAALDEVLTAMNMKFNEMTRGFEEVKGVLRNIDIAKGETHRNGDERPPHYGGLGSAARN